MDYCEDTIKSDYLKILKGKKDFSKENCKDKIKNENLPIDSKDEDFPRINSKDKFLDKINYN